MSNLNGHERRLRRTTVAYNEGIVALRAARDEAVAAAHDTAGMSYQTIATICEMSMENVRKIVREQRAVRT